MARSTLGLGVGAVVLAVGLVLVLLPQDFSGSSTLVAGDYRSAGNQNLGLVDIPVVAANLSIGGASLTVTFSVSNGTLVNAYLYTSTAGEGVWDQTPGTAISISSALNTTSGTLTDPQVSPGEHYDAIFFVPNGGSPTITVSWSGAIDFPYAYLGIPLVIAGAVILIAVVSVLPQREEERTDSVQTGVPVQEAYVYEAPRPMIESPPPSASLSPAAPIAALPPGGEYTPASSSPPQFAPRPSASTPPPARRSLWKPVPIARPADSESSPSESLFRQRAAVASPSPATSPVPGGVPPVATATPSPGAEGGSRCPQCRLTIGDPSWAFCPRCRAELP